MAVQQLRVLLCSVQHQVSLTLLQWSSQRIPACAKNHDYAFDGETLRLQALTKKVQAECEINQSWQRSPFPQTGGCRVLLANFEFRQSRKRFRLARRGIERCAAMYLQREKLNWKPRVVHLIDNLSKGIEIYAVHYQIVGSSYPTTAIVEWNDAA